MLIDYLRLRKFQICGIRVHYLQRSIFHIVSMDTIYFVYNVESLGVNFFAEPFFEMRYFQFQHLIATKSRNLSMLILKREIKY